MRTRIICPFHHEETPSLVRRPNDWYCYGACNRSFTHAEVETKMGQVVDYEIEQTEKENLSERIAEIDLLPITSIRGLRLPADRRGYYLVWPDQSFYKYRLFEPGKGPKYIGPKGHKPPLFWARQKRSQVLCLSEGEINSLSLAQAIPEYDHCSPGSATMFNKDNLTKYLPIFDSYTTLLVVLDNDAAGLKALIETKTFFLGKHPFVSFLLLPEDANEILIKYGKDTLRTKVLGAHFR